MYRTCQNLFFYCAVIFSLALAKQALAEELPGDEILLEAMATSKPINQGGLIYDLPKTNPQLLALDVEQLRGAYIRRQHELAQQVESKQLNAGDAIITVIMPGGLLYAGFRKQQFEQAKSALQLVDSEIQELSNDLVSLKFEDASHPVILAQFP